MNLLKRLGIGKGKDVGCDCPECKESGEEKMDLGSMLEMLKSSMEERQAQEESRMLGVFFTNMNTFVAACNSKGKTTLANKGSAVVEKLIEVIISSQQNGGYTPDEKAAWEAKNKKPEAPAPEVVADPNQGTTEQA